MNTKKKLVKAIGTKISKANNFWLLPNNMLKTISKNSIFLISINLEGRDNTTTKLHDKNIISSFNVRNHNFLIDVEV